MLWCYLFCYMFIWRQLFVLNGLSFRWMFCSVSLLGISYQLIAWKDASPVWHLLTVLYRFCCPAVHWHGICYGIVAVCLLRWCIVPKRLSQSRLSRSSGNFRQVVVQPFLFSHTKCEPNSSRGSSSLRASDGRDGGKSREIKLIHQRATLDSTVWKAVFCSIFY